MWTFPEAFVPLPDGKSIPVKFDNSQGHTMVENKWEVTIHAVDSRSFSQMIQSNPDSVALAVQKVYNRKARLGGPYR